jgi:hypothetical protein
LSTRLGSDVELGEERVFQVQDWAEVHRLLHREGWAKMKIAETLGMSRNTVVRLFELDDDPPQYQRVPRGLKLDPCKGSIVKMLDEDSKVPATVIIEYLRRDGFWGGVACSHAPDQIIGTFQQTGLVSQSDIRCRVLA